MFARGFPAETKRGMLSPVRASFLVAITAVTLLIAGGTAGNVLATTGPAKQRYVYLIATDNTLTFHNDDLTQLTRGSYLRLYVLNEGKKPVEVELQGRRTPLIKPAQHAQTPWIYFGARGRFRFVDLLNKAMYGYIEIY
jgi:hypothetical protein